MTGSKYLTTDIKNICTQDFAKSVLVALNRYPTATHVALFVNCNLDSSELGTNQCIVVGPNNTFQSVEDCIGRWLNDLPSQRQQFIRAITVEDFRKGIE